MSVSCLHYVEYLIIFQEVLVEHAGNQRSDSMKTALQPMLEEWYIHSLLVLVVKCSCPLNYKVNDP